MNNETRKAMMEVIEAELDSYCPSPFNGAFAVSLMQIIDRLLAEHNIDHLLNAVHPKARVLHQSQVESEQWYVEIGWTTTDYSFVPAKYKSHERVGYGPTRTAAIADACRKAREDRP